MSLLQQIQGVIYSFVCSFSMCLIYAILNRIFYFFGKSIARLFIQVCIGLLFGYIFYRGIVYINDGMIRIYFIISFLLGYLFYNIFYSFYWLVMVEKWMYYFKKILFPLYFIFFKFRAILIRVRKVKIWRKKQIEDNY